MGREGEPKIVVSHGQDEIPSNGVSLWLERKMEKSGENKPVC